MCLLSNNTLRLPKEELVEAFRVLNVQDVKDFLFSAFQTQRPMNMSDDPEFSSPQDIAAKTCLELMRQGFVEENAIIVPLTIGEELSKTDEQLRDRLDSLYTIFRKYMPRRTISFSVYKRRNWSVDKGAETE